MENLLHNAGTQLIKFHGTVTASKYLSTAQGVKL